MKKGGFGKNKPVLITIVALVVLAAMILASAGKGTANWFENAVGAVLTPVQGFAARASNSIADFFRGVFNTTDVWHPACERKPEKQTRPPSLKRGLFLWRNFFYGETR